MSGLKLADADFDLSANAIEYRKIAIGKSGLSLHLKNGRLEADLSQIELYQGKGSAKVVADDSGTVPAIAADIDLANVQIEPLFRDAAGFDRVTGTGSFNMAVTGHGNSQREIIGSLDGKGALDLVNGKIKGVNLVAMLKNVASSFTSQNDANETDFGALNGSYTITNGILRNDDLKLVSPQIPMTGKGTVDLPKRSVDYRLDPSVAGVLAVPVTIEGPWDDLSYRPDFAGMAQGLAQDPGKALGALKNTVPGGTKPSDLLKGLFGR
jgi:AsmA protein